MGYWVHVYGCYVTEVIHDQRLWSQINTTTCLKKKILVFELKMESSAIRLSTELKTSLKISTAQNCPSPMSVYPPVLLPLMLNSVNFVNVKWYLFI